MAVTIEGASDDLIEIGGDIYEEFGYRDEESGDLLAFSDGTVLRITFSNSGVWRIVPVVNGRAELKVVPAPEDDEDNGTDRATLDGDVRWVVRGDVIARRRRQVEEVAG